MSGRRRVCVRVFAGKSWVVENDGDVGGGGASSYGARVASSFGEWQLAFRGARQMAVDVSESSIKHEN